MDSGEEKRVAMYGEAYTFAEFVEYYKDGAQWYWDQAKPAEATPTEEAAKEPPMQNVTDAVNPDKDVYQQGAARFKQVNRVCQQSLLLAAFALRVLGLPLVIRDIIFLHGGDQWTGNVGHFFQLLVTRTDADIRAAVKHWCSNPVVALVDCGPISCWDVSQVTDMGGLFHEQRKFNDSLYYWDVRNVVNMLGMFERASNFDQDISVWNIKRVREMSSMFSFAYSFDQDISVWNIKRVRDMGAMFYCASAFNQNLDSWAVSADTGMNCMFHNTTSLEQKPAWYKEN